MSNEPQRYEPELDFGDDDNNEPSIVNYTSPSGRFVLFSDWEALKVENQRLNIEVARLNDRACSLCGRKYLDHFPPDSLCYRMEREQPILTGTVFTP